MSLKNFKSILILLIVASAGCGKSKTATVTLATGLNPPTSFSNFMSQIAEQNFTISSTSTCTQTQIYAGYGPENQGNTDAFSTFAVGLSTPLADLPSILSYSSGGATGAAAWLRSSTLQPIQFTVPVGTSIGFGVAGSLTVATNPSADGTCPLMNSAGMPNPTFSIIGHSKAVITASTVVPVQLWITNSAPTVATDLPVNPGGNCNAGNGNGGGNSDNFSQQCPNLNFRQMLLQGCTAASTCGSLLNSGYAEINYFSAINGSQHITQRIPLSGSTGTAATPVAGLTSLLGGVLPDFGHYNVRLFSSTGTLTEELQYQNQNGGPGSPPTPTPYFVVTATGANDLGYLNVLNNTTTPTPSVAPVPVPVPVTLPIMLTVTQNQSSGFNFTWNSVPGANSYDVQLLNITTSTVTLPFTNLAASTILVSPSSLVTGNSYLATIIAKDASSTVIATSSNVPITPVGNFSAGASPSTGQINFLSLLATGADHFDIYYSTTAGGPFSNEVGGFPILATAPSSGSYLLSNTTMGLTTGTAYYFQVKAYNSASGLYIYTFLSSTTPY